MDNETGTILVLVVIAVVTVYSIAQYFGNLV